MKSQNSKTFRFCIAASQIIIWPLVAMLAFVRSKRVIKKLEKTDIEKSDKYIIVANHGRKSDPFIILRHLPIKIFFILIPFRFMTYNTFIDAWFGPILRILGSYPAKQHKKYSFGLEASKIYLDLHEPVVIFPEGKRNNGVERPKPRNGISVLANDDVKLIPVFIDWHYPKGKPKYNMVIGKPFKAAGLKPDKIMDKVYSLSGELER